MIKLFLQLVAIHGALCAPGSPFLEYGIPAENNLAEKSLPLDKLGSVSSTAFEDLPGTRNLAAHSQLPLDLPGTRNLGEKSIPDSITLRRIPSPSLNFELPRYAYDGGFLRGGEQLDIAFPPVNFWEKNQQGYPQEYQPETSLYPNSTPDEKTGSEIKGTEFLPSSNNPQGAFQPPLITPGESNSGSALLGTFVQPDSKPVGNSGGALESINIPPSSSIKVQDGHGQYSHGFANPDGTEIQESGHLISTDDGWEYVIAKEGSYRYLSPEGIPISVRYIADENGFRILSQNFAGR